MVMKKRGRKKTTTKTAKTAKKTAGAKTKTAKKTVGAAKRGRKKSTRGRKKATTKKPAKKRKKSGRKAVKPAKKTTKKKGRKKKVSARRSKKQGVTPVVTPKLSRKRNKRKPSKAKAPSHSKVILNYLTEHAVPFNIIKHSPTFTAQQTAESAHVSGKNIAKTIIVKIDGRLAIVVEPAHLKVDLDALKRQLNVETVELATEAEFRHHFPDCELGAMPPLGPLYNMDVYVSDNLAHDESIIFNAGTHSELVEMAYEDFYNLTHPKVVYA